MKTGIIIVFHNSEKHIDKDLFIRCAEQLLNLKFCLVNNESKDETYNLLKEIKEECENVSVVNIKKFKSDISAVKAGARFMFNQSEFKHLGYVNMNLLDNKYQGLNYIIQAILEHQDSLIEYDQRVIEKYSRRTTLFQKLFSVIDYLTKLKLESQTENILYLNKL